MTRAARCCWSPPARSPPACSAWAGPRAPRHARPAGRRRRRPDGPGPGLRTTFLEHGLKAAQILLTHEDLADRTRYLNARSTLHTLLELGVVPIINENDTVVTDEIKFGDNDTLGALVANLVEAEALVILTDQKGLYSADPRAIPSATLISEGAPTTALRSHGRRCRQRHQQGRHDHQGTRRPARRAQRRPYADRQRPRAEDSLLRLAHGEASAPCSTPRIAAGRAQAMAGRPPATGRQPDAGCRRGKGAGRGRSLLAVGVTDVGGEFQRGAAVACRAPGRPRDRPRPGQLLKFRSPPHRRPWHAGHRSPAGLHRQRGTDSPGQPDPAVLQAKKSHPEGWLFSFQSASARGRHGIRRSDADRRRSA
jgi:hypothetical protein